MYTGLPFNSLKYIQAVCIEASWLDCNVQGIIQQDERQLLGG